MPVVVGGLELCFYFCLFNFKVIKVDLFLFDLFVELDVLEELYMLTIVDLKEAAKAHKRPTRVQNCFKLL